MSSVKQMYSGNETYRGAAGWAIKYPPPGSLGKDGGHYPNPFLTLKTETRQLRQTRQSSQTIFRSFGVRFGEEEENVSNMLKPIPELD